MTPEKRRAVFDRVVDRWSKHGLEFETSPVFRAKVDDWIEGRISIQDLRQHYSEFARARSRRAPELTATET